VISRCRITKRAEKTLGRALKVRFEEMSGDDHFVSGTGIMCPCTFEIKPFRLSNLGVHPRLAVLGGAIYIFYMSPEKT